MKIITGKLKGKTIKDYKIEGTRPTMDRVKESIFSTIQNYIKDSICLDLFAGTGNLGIEAISEGAKLCYFIDKNSIAINSIKNTVNDFNIKMNSIIINSDCFKFLKSTNEKFDIIFLDPPYDLKISDKLFRIIKEFNILKDKGLIIYEYTGDFIKNDEYEIIKEKKYGEKKVTIFKKRGKSYEFVNRCTCKF